MTEQLKTMMDRAADQDFAAVDLDAITGSGDRTVRRRRVATGVAGVAVLAVVTTAAAVFGGDDGARKSDFGDESFRTDVPMWTEGSTLHTPDRTWDLGVEVATFVRTSEGVVFLGWEDDDALGVYSFTGGDDPDRIGETEGFRLRGDPTGPYVGWLDGSADALTTVIWDQRDHKRAWEQPARAEYSFPIVAIDGSSAYLADVDEGPVAVVDLESRERTDLPDDEIYRNFVAAEGEVVARRIMRPGGGVAGLEVGPPDGGFGILTRLPGVDADGAVLSPDARWISTFGGDVTVHDTKTGTEVPVETDGYSDGLGYEWLDFDTLMVLGVLRDGGDVALLSCEIPAGTCTRHTTLPDLEGDVLAAVGIGEVIWGSPGEASGSADATMEVEETSSTERPE